MFKMHSIYTFREASDRDSFSNVTVEHEVGFSFIGKFPDCFLAKSLRVVYNRLKIVHFDVPGSEEHNRQLVYAAKNFF